ncbi:MAG: TIGR03960 family B12-binding radical SAM protein [Halothermotrichaceae bacterium]
MELADKIDKHLHKVTNPTRYIGNEWNAVRKEWTEDKIKVAVAFPDLYEIGMSHLGLKIIYHLLNNESDIVCERCYAPWTDMEELMREKQIPLFSLENKREIKNFDVLGFTLQYEMSYTNILNMMNLAGIPLYSRDRNEKYPLVIAGGSTVFNPEPIAPFIDLFFIGETEDEIVNLIHKYDKYKKSGLNRSEILKKLSKIDGVYIPDLYKVSYNDNGEIQAINAEDDVKSEIRKQIVTNLDQSFYPTDFIVPYFDIVHDRAVLEVARGCSRGCRFCAAGMTYRPVRERSKETIMRLADDILKNTGYEEISLSSLSTADYTEISDLVKTMSKKYEDRKISISLPSLRVDEFSVNLAKEVQRVRKSGLTFAPEAGSQRLRNVINKGVDEDDLYEAVRAAFEKGWSTIKLYFMIGLPTETKEDLQGIVELSKKVLKIGKEIRKQKKKRMRRINIHVSVSTFIPKPFTPFQWVRMDHRQEIIEKQDYLRKNVKGKGLSLSWNDVELSLLEGVFSRGDRRLAEVLKSAWEKGCRFDGWSDNFEFESWQESFAENQLEIEDYLRQRNNDELLPWNHLNMGISDKFLKKEYQRAVKGEKTDDCRSHGCTGCNICFELDTAMELIGGEDSAD